jgi:uncharacterized membrane protein
VSEAPENTTEEHTTPTRKASTFVITREMFDEVAVYRMRYIALFIAIFLWWVITRAMIFFMAPVPPEEAAPAAPETVIESTQVAPEAVIDSTEALVETEAPSTNIELSMPDFDAMAQASGIPAHILIASLVLLLILYATFYYNFAKAARIMGWAWWWIVPTLMVISIPILGVLPMGVTDRRLADQWDKADDEHTRYRERVYAEDEEEVENEA